MERKGRTRKRRQRYRLLRRLGFNAAPGQSWRYRVWCLVTRHPRHWWDWGGMVMVVVGWNEGGTWSYPEPDTWWYRYSIGRRQRYTGFPVRRYEVIKSYDEFRKLTKGMSRDEIIDAGWNAINASQDGEMQLGWQYWGSGFYGLPKAEQRILQRWLRAARRRDWWGLRSWIYSQALHAKVHQKRPFRCNEVPPKGSGGYPHWHCGLKRRHDGMHRVGSYVWGEIDGEPMGAVYMPKESAS